LRQETASLKAEMVINQEKVEEYQTIDSLNQEKAKQQQTIEALNQEKAEQHRTIEALNQEKSEQRQTIEAFEKEKAEQNQIITAFNYVKAEQLHAIETLRRAKAEQQRMLENVYREKAEQQLAIANLKHLTAEQRRAIETLNQEKAEQQRTIENINQEKAEQQHTIENLGQENVYWQQRAVKLNEAKADLENVMQQRMLCSRDLANWQHRVDKLNQDKQDLTSVQRDIMQQRLEHYERTIKLICSGNTDLNTDGSQTVDEKSEKSCGSKELVRGQSSGPSSSESLPCERSATETPRRCGEKVLHHGNSSPCARCGSSEASGVLLGEDLSGESALARVDHSGACDSYPQDSMQFDAMIAQELGSNLMVAGPQHPPHGTISLVGRRSWFSDDIVPFQDIRCR
jgi:hypothetical protein